MPSRRQPIFPEQIYHVFNRSIACEPIFFYVRDRERFINITSFYRFSSPNLRFSYYNRLSIADKKDFMEKLRKNGEKLISIYAFCLMPNHFHFLLKELKKDGVRKFASNLQNSYAKYFNTKRKRQGSLFQEMFKAVRVETDEQFIHVARYIHLNPYSSFVIENISDLYYYQWSSLADYLGNNSQNFLEKDFLYGFYSSKEKFISFTFNQADYQRKLQGIKHLTLE